jgi:uncharacterized protein
VVVVELVGVGIDPETKVPYVELKAGDDSGRVLPILIGLAEASSIKAALEGKTTPRPMTHDLFADTLRATGLTLDLVVVTEFRDNIYFAELHLSRGEQRTVVSARPSDALALAARTSSPIFVADAVLAEFGVVRPEPEAEGQALDSPELLDEFRRFIDDLNPDDFR